MSFFKNLCKLYQNLFNDTLVSYLLLLKTLLNFSKFYKYKLNFILLLKSKLKSKEISIKKSYISENSVI